MVAMEKINKEKMLRIWIAIICLLFVIVFLWPFSTVPPGHRGVLTTFGKIDQSVYNEGIHFRLPLIQTMYNIDVRIQKSEIDGVAASRDLQSIKTSIALNYHVRPESVVSVFRDLGQDLSAKIVNPTTQEAIKAAAASYTAEELITKRPEVREKIRGLVAERLTKYGAEVDDLAITNFYFSKSFTDAVDAKTTAEQQKLKADRDLQRIRVEAEQKVAQAKAEAEALKMQKQEVTHDLLRLREIENQRRAIEKWNGVLPSTTTGTGVPFINIQPSK